MRLQEVLNSVPGLEKRFVYYLESQGYIQPQKVQKARISRRDYSLADLERTRGIWHYYQRGISVQRAYELVTRAAADGAYVFFPVPPRRWPEALALLRQSDHVMEASALYGETADFAARLRAPHESDVHNVLDRLFEAGIVAGAPHVLRFRAEARWERPLAATTDVATPPPPVSQRAAAAADRPPQSVAGSEPRQEPSVMRAWVLIKVPAKQIGALIEELHTYPGIVEAAGIYGETDVIAKIEVADQDTLDELVVQRIQSLDAVESTRTFIAIGAMHWVRPT
ncbi:MAG: Lrp/AsnC ligand binding domain-containing protein [Chloroflexota bacterium]|nr:Lrp/AsnC ligand binding domain-containing protein [Chloroflexota bacterium]